MAGVSPRTLYLFESDATRNQNWVPTVANIVIGNFTEGEDYCKMDYPYRKQKRFYTGLKITDLASATSIILKKGKRGYLFTIKAKCYTKASSDYIDQFLLANEHVRATNYEDYYMVLVHDAGTYEKFTDDNGTRRDYLQCGILDGTITEVNQGDNSFVWEVSLVVKSAFR